MSKENIVLSDGKVGALNILKNIVLSRHPLVPRGKLEKMPEIRP